MSIKNLVTSFAFTAVFAVNLSAQTFTKEDMLATGIPIISIKTENNAAIVSKEYYINIESFEVTDPNNPGNDMSRRKSDVARPDIGRFADEIRGRGNATWQNMEWNLNYPKKPYRIRFTDQQKMLGLPKARNWVLLAEYRDPSFMFNALAFEVARNVFNMPFTHNYIHVHLFLNDDYKGLYGLTEHKQVHENRINIDPDEGWYVNIDEYYDEDPKFRTNQYNLPIMIKSPEPDGANHGDHPAFQFVKDDWNRLCDLMQSWEFPNNGYRDHIDINSLIDYLLVNEITMNQELGNSSSPGHHDVRSMLAYKDRGGKITFGPVWDFDCGYGYNYQSTHQYFERHDQFIMKIPFLQRFYQDTIFTAMLKRRWNEKYQNIKNISGYVDNLSSKIALAVAEDTRRWYRDNNLDHNSGYVSNQYNTNFNAVVSNLKNWWNSRADWLNNAINNLPGTLPQPPVSAAPAPVMKSAIPSVILRDRILNVSSPNGSDLRIRLIDVRGRVRANFNSAGSERFLLANIPAGRYFVEVNVTGGDKRVTPVVLK